MDDAGPFHFSFSPSLFLDKDEIEKKHMGFDPVPRVMGAAGMGHMGSLFECTICPMRVVRM